MVPFFDVAGDDFFGEGVCEAFLDDAFEGWRLATAVRAVSCQPGIGSVVEGAGESGCCGWARDLAIEAAELGAVARKSRLDRWGELGYMGANRRLIIRAFDILQGAYRGRRV